jgi:hypothetical protein
MTSITFDIETLPDMRPGKREAFIAASRENFKAPSVLTKEQAAADLGMTDPAEIKFTSKDRMLFLWAQRFAEEKAEEVGDAEWRKTSFDGARGMVCCIGLALDDAAPVSFWRNDYATAEADMLREFFAVLAAHREMNHMARPRFVGHNIASFDIRFIYQRAIINRVPVPLWWPINARPWDDVLFDTMTQWAGHGSRVSLDNLCAALGIEGKDGMDGSMVADAVMQGRIADVAAYCEHDVRIARECYRRMTFVDMELV